MKKVVLRIDLSDPWEHMLVYENDRLLSDNIEDHFLSPMDVLRELQRLNIIEFEIEEV